MSAKKPTKKQLEQLIEFEELVRLHAFEGPDSLTERTEALAEEKKRAKPVFKDEAPWKTLTFLGIDVRSTADTRQLWANWEQAARREIARLRDALQV